MDKNWFTVKKIYPNIWGIGEFKHPEEVISYLFVGDNQALLFDTGLGINNISKIVESITSLPVRVINSHSHFDHIGGNKYFQKILKIKDNSTISILPFKFIKISTPGHTPDSICLFEKKMGIVVSGDTFYPGPIYLYFKESNFKDYKKSIAKLSKLSIKFILPGHNSFKCKPRILKSLNMKLAAIIPKMLNNNSVKIERNLSLRFK